MPKRSRGGDAVPSKRLKAMTRDVAWDSHFPADVREMMKSNVDELAKALTKEKEFTDLLKQTEERCARELEKEYRSGSKKKLPSCISG